MRATKGVAVCFIALHASVSHVQTYPAKLIRVVTASAGGGTD